MANVSRGYINVIMIVATKNILIDVTTKQFNFFDVAQNFERKMLDTLFPIRGSYNWHASTFRQIERSTHDS